MSGYDDGIIKYQYDKLEQAIQLISWSLDWAGCFCGHPSHTADEYTKQANAFLIGEGAHARYPTKNEEANFDSDVVSGDVNPTTCDGRCQRVYIRNFDHPQASRKECGCVVWEPDGRIDDSDCMQYKVRS